MSNTNASLHEALVELTENEINQVAGGANCFWGGQEYSKGGTVTVTDGTVYECSGDENGSWLRK